MAMLNNPALLIMDEPTTALDVTVEAAVLDLIEDLKKDFNTAYHFHHPQLGRGGPGQQPPSASCTPGSWLKKGPINDLFAQPAHPYTRGCSAVSRA